MARKLKDRNGYPIEHPPGWENMGWRERRTWCETYIWGKKKSEYQKKQYLEDTFNKRIAKIKSFRKRKWNDEKLMDWLRIATDKELMGFSIKSAERLNDLVKAFYQLRTIKSNYITQTMQKLVRQELEKIGDKCVMSLKTIVALHYDMATKDRGEHLRDDLVGYKRLSPHVFEKDGVVYKKIAILINRNDLVRAQAIMQLEGIQLRDWIRQRLVKYVSMKFRKLGEVQGMIDKEIDKSISDKEMEGGVEDAVKKTTNKREEKEVEGKSISNNKEDIEGGK